MTHGVTKIKKLKENIDSMIPLKPSNKHMNHHDLPNMEPAPSLKRFMPIAA